MSGKNLAAPLPLVRVRVWLRLAIKLGLGGNNTVYRFLCLINGYLFFRCLEKVFEEERNENKKGDHSS